MSAPQSLKVTREALLEQLSMIETEIDNDIAKTRREIETLQEQLAEMCEERRNLPSFDKRAEMSDDELALAIYVLNGDE